MGVCTYLIIDEEVARTDGNLTPELLSIPYLLFEVSQESPLGALTIVIIIT